MKFVKRCLGAGATLALVSMPAFAAGQLSDEKPLQQQQVTDEKPVQQQQQQQQQQVQQLQHAAQSSLIIRETDDGKGGVKQEVRSLTIRLVLDEMTDDQIEAAFESADDVDGINVAMDENSANEMYPRRGFNRGYYGRGYGPYVYGPGYNSYYYGNPYYYPGRNAAWWLLPFLLR